MAAACTSTFPATSRVLVVFFGIFAVLLGSYGESAGRTFGIDYDQNCFVKDGEPFRYISGSMHYARVPPEFWKDRLTKMYAAGLNAVQTYIPWNLHEPEEGAYTFKGIANLPGFLQLVKDTGLLAIIRPGPYICAEWDMGGIPSWILKKSPGVYLRTMDPGYIKYVDLWLDQLLSVLLLYTYENQGPIIAVQIENEYGSYPACDFDYLRYLHDKFAAVLGNNLVLFTTDGAATGDLKCGTLQGLYSTVDFGVGSDVKEKFAIQRMWEPKGPLVNSEFYTGWLDHWGQPHSHVDKDSVANKLDEMLAMNASVNMYMFEGGTNFGFMNGANGDLKEYHPQPTSYDYDAPLSEAGDPTDKFTTLRNVIGKYRTLPELPVPPATRKYEYGMVAMSRTASFADSLGALCPDGPIQADTPITFEDMQQSYGFMLYTAPVAANYTNATTLSVPGIRDRGYVWVGGAGEAQPMGVLSRMAGNTTVNVTASQGDTLSILVENQGRINYGSAINDTKGIIGNVLIGNQTMTKWSVYSLDLDRVVSQINSGGLKLWSPPLPIQLAKPGREEDLHFRKRPLAQDEQFPAFFSGSLQTDTPGDTFLKLDGWIKGQAYMNGFNLGRYWPNKGPQKTLYVPGSVLKAAPDTNTLVLFELEGSPCNSSAPTAGCSVFLSSRAVINGTVGEQ